MGRVEQLPLGVGVAFSSAILQTIAEDHDVDLLHIKGPALDASLLDHEPIEDDDTGVRATRPVPRRSVDADVLVRPSHVARLFDAMRRHGWTMAYRFEDGSAFEHASTWLRPGVSSADVHRTFPGVGLDPGAAFDLLWADRRQAVIAGYACWTPSLPAQRLILLLHAARGGQLTSGDVRRAWDEATPVQRDEVDALATALRAEVALASVTGRLDRYRGVPEYALWRALSSGETSRLVLWAARVRAQPTARAAVRTAFWLVMPKPGRLERTLGRKPTGREVLRAWRAQLSLAASELRRTARRLPGVLRRRS